jgi:flavin-dependent dehydrogenase
MTTKKRKVSSPAGNSERVARDLCDTGFQVIIYGEASDPGVRSVLEWTYGNGIAMLNPDDDVEIHRRKIALLSQCGTSGYPFAEFASRFLARNIGHIYELRVINAARSDAEERIRA